MNQRIDDELLISVLEGRATKEIQDAVELAIQQESSVRLRMELLSGAVDWPPGSAPVISQPISDSLNTAIRQLEQEWERGLARENLNPNSDKEIAVAPEANAIPPLRIVREIGRGGMGVIYEGFDEALGRRVAIKQLHLHILNDTKASERLQREAHAIASLSHPNVLAIYGTQLVEGYPCLIQQFVDGESLYDAIRRDGPVPFPRCAELALQIAQGLAAAHAVGIVHRDLKPANILVEHGTGIARLCDFGLAKRVGDENMSVEGVVAGTPAYMAPEQTDGKAVDRRSDLFSLGAVMYTMASGQAPFESDDPFVVMDTIRNRPHQTLGSLSIPVPKWYSVLVDRLLEKNPDQRLQSIDEVVDAIRNQTSQVSAFRLGRFLVTPAVTLVTMVAVAALGWFLITNTRRDHEGEPPQTAISSNSAPTRPAIQTASDGRSFRRLEEAVDSSRDGETIVIADDLVTGRIDIIGKKIQLEAAPGTHPTIRFRNQGNDSSNVFLRSDSDLTLKGLRLECQPTATTPWFEDGRFIAGIYTGQGKKLQVENCEIYRNGGGICVGAGGDLDLRRTWIEGGDVAIGWFALDNTCLVEESLLQSKIGIGVIYPGANMKPSQSAEFVIVQSSLVTDEVLDLLLARIPDQPVALTFRQCVLDSKHATSLWMTPLLASENSTNASIINTMTQSVLWKDEMCVFAQGMDFLITRRLRIPNRKTSAGIFSLQEWTEKCARNDASVLTKESPSVQRTIHTVIPDVAIHRKSKNSPQWNVSPGISGSIHQFTPELSNPWPSDD